MSPSRYAVVVAAIALAAWVSPCAAWDPQGWARSSQQVDHAPDEGLVSLPFRWLLGVYQSTVSRVDGDRCPSYPTCSVYARQALSRHGPLLGMALTAARLLGEADEPAFAPRIRIEGAWKVYSPVERDLAFLRGGLDP